MAQGQTNQTDLQGTLAECGLSGIPWYTILDAARDDTMPARASEAGLQVRSLYEGKLGDQLADVAPHLTTLELDNDFARWLLNRWGGQQGILLHHGEEASQAVDLVQLPGQGGRPI
ncbi:MAG: DUF4123 domain-containing protein, partial [bacterium]|nr:DUF4123 domain-containing protein [bacterium]